MERTLTVPTLLTLGRLAVAPWIGLAIVDHAWGLACILFIIAALTDAVDGTLARWLQQESWFGACLDPIADKVLMITCYAALATAAPIKVIPGWFVSIIFFKDVLLVAGTLSSGVITVRPSVFGKIAMGIQTIFVAWTLICAWMHWLFPELGALLFSAVLGSSIFAFAHYTMFALRGWLVWFVRD